MYLSPHLVHLCALSHRPATEQARSLEAELTTTKVALEDKTRENLSLHLSLTTAEEKVSQTNILVSRLENELVALSSPNKLNNSNNSNLSNSRNNPKLGLSRDLTLDSPKTTDLSFSFSDPASLSVSGSLSTLVSPDRPDLSNSSYTHSNHNNLTTQGSDVNRVQSLNPNDLSKSDSSAEDGPDRRLLTVVTGQRDRFRLKLEHSEEANNTLRSRLDGLTRDLAALKVLPAYTYPKLGFSGQSGLQGLTAVDIVIL